MNSIAAKSDPNRSGNSGPYCSVLNNDSENGLSFDTRGRECERVTSRSARSGRDSPTGHRCSAVGVDHVRNAMDREDLFHQFSCQQTGFVRVNMDADDVARVGLGRASPVKVLNKSSRELSSTHKAARTCDEPLHIARARATIPVRRRRHLTSSPTPSAQNLGTRAAYQDG